MNTQIIAIANQKGGVGKTTTAVNLAAALALASQKTLLIDSDPQCNATSGVGLPSSDIENSIYHLYLGQKNISELIWKSPFENLDVLPAEPDLVGIDIELVARESREFILKEQLERLTGLYDYIIIDCPPALNLMTVNALSAAHSVLVPVQCQYYALEGLSHLMRTLEMLKEGLNPQLIIEGLVMTMYEPGNDLAGQVVADVKEHFPNQVFQTMIGKDSALSAAPGFGKPCVFYDLRSAGAEDYVELCREVLAKEDRRAEARQEEDSQQKGLEVV